MNKPVINKLKYPMWFQIVFYCSTVAIPVCLILAEGLTSKQSWFKWSFALIATIVIAWSAIYKWLLTGMRDKIAERKTKLEHDYEIDVGDTNKIKYNHITVKLLKICNKEKILKTEETEHTTFKG